MPPLPQTGRRKRFLKTFAAAVVLALLVLPFLPYQRWIEAELIRRLEAQGLSQVSLSVESMGMHGVRLRDVRFGEVQLAEVTLGYVWRDLREGRINDIYLQNPIITVRMDEKGMRIEGVSLPAQTDAKEGWALSPERVASLPFRSIVIENGVLNFESPTIKAQWPFRVEIRTQEKPGLSVKLSSSQVKAGAQLIELGEAQLDVTPDAKGAHWQGEWSVASISSKHWPELLGAITAKGNLSYEENSLNAKADVRNTAKTAQAQVTVSHRPGGEKPPEMTLRNASFAWGGGYVRVKQMALLPAANTPWRVKLEFDHVSLDEVLKTITGGKASATGTIEGSLPFAVYRDGRFEMGEGDVHVADAGQIHMSPEAIPESGNEQLNLVRQILQNFHYETFSIGVSKQSKGAPGFTLRLFGRNPDVYGGRDIKLNVQLGGDVLQVIKSSILPINNPEALMQQESK